MKIVFIIDQVYLHGGIERVLSIKANYLVSMPDNEIYIITTEQKDKKPCYEFNDKIIFKDLGINYQRNKSYFHPVNLRKLPKHIKKTKSVIKKINPDIVVVCSHSTDTYFIPFINKDIPKVKEFHYSKFIELENRKNPRNLQKKYFLKFADYVETKYDKLVILNQDEAAYYTSDNTIVIPNPLTFYPEKVSTISNNIVITAGRIASVKGYDMLIDIWEIVSKKHPGWELHIYGDGEPGYVRMLQDKIDAKNLQDHLLLKGVTSDVKGKMLASSIFAMSSHNECFPLVLLEAQACGLPIISFDCPNGPRNIVNTQNGVLIPIYNNVEFANQLIELMNNRVKLEEMGKSARQNASNYSVENVMKLWNNMFNELLNL